MGQLKCDNVYLFNNMIDNLQYQFLEKFVDDDNNKDENV